MIVGNNINLRPLESRDIELFYSWNTDQEIMGEYMHAEQHYKEAFVEGMKKSLSGSNNQFVMVIEGKDGEPIGVVNYGNSAFSNVSVDFGIIIADKYSRGKGVGKEAVMLLVDYLFNAKNISRIQFMTRADNEAMKSLGKKAGFIMEGVLRKYRFDHGECWDICLFSMTRDDWKKLNSR